MSGLKRAGRESQSSPSTHEPDNYYSPSLAVGKYKASTQAITFDLDALVTVCLFGAPRAESSWKISIQDENSKNAYTTSTQVIL